MAEPVVEYDTYGPPRTSAFASSNPGLSGWLYKSSGGKRTILVKFDRRWFVLDGAVLRYYTSDSLETEKGAIPLGDVVEVKTLVQGSATFGTFPPAECRFELVTSARNWVLAVDPKEDINALKKTWVDGISAATGLVPRRSGLSFYAASAGRDTARRGAHSGFLWMRKANKKLGWKERLVALDGDVLRVFKEQRGARPASSASRRLANPPPRQASASRRSAPSRAASSSACPRRAAGRRRRPSCASSSRWPPARRSSSRAAALNSTAGSRGPDHSSVTSTSIRLLFGRTDCSRRVLEAQP